ARVVEEVAFGEGDDAGSDPEQAEDREVLPGLRHDALIGGYDEQHRVDAADPREHVADEVLMTRDVDETDVTTARQRHPGEAEIDRHAPLAFLTQAVGIHAGQRGEEGRFSVIDVTRGAHDADRGRLAHCGVGMSCGEHMPKSSGTTTKASTSMSAIQSPSAIPVATGGSGDRSLSSASGGRRRIRSRCARRAEARWYRRSSARA